MARAPSPITGRPTSFPIAALVVIALAPNVNGQWSQNSGTGPSLYTDTANWTGGTITGTFASDPTTGLQVTWGADYVMTGSLTLAYNGTRNITFRSDSAMNRTITMAGNWTATGSGGGTITIGTVANPLTLNLNGTTRTFGGNSTGNNPRWEIYAKLTNSTGTAGFATTNNGGYVYLHNDANDFNGPVTFSRRGGGFSSIKNVGGGASALGAPTTAANGLITVNDSTSYGQLDYTGTGDTSDREWRWNNGSTSAGLPLRNMGSGKLTLTGTQSWSTNNVPFNFQAVTADLDLLGVLKPLTTQTNSMWFSSGTSTTPRTITLGSANLYTGSTAIYNVTLVASSIKNVGGGASSLGAPTTAANGTIALGSGTQEGRLRYTGTGDTTDRVLTLSGSTGGGTVEANGSDALVFTGSVAVTGSGSKMLTLGGTSTALNEIRGGIGNFDATAVTSVVKSDVGRWLLSGSSGYTGTTTISGGTLAVGNDTAVGTGSLAVNAGTLDLGNRTLAAGALSGSSGGTITTSSNAAASLTTSLAGSGTFAGAITNGSGTVAFVKSGVGTLALTGTSTFTGGVTLASGTLVSTGTQGLGATINAVTIGTTAANVALQLGGTSSFTAPQPITVSSLGSGQVIIGSATSSATLTYGGSIVLGRAATLQAGTSDRLTFTNAISGSGNLTIATPLLTGGRVTFTQSGSATANTFVGDITIENGAQLQVGLAGTTNNWAIPDTTSIFFNAQSSTSTVNLRLSGQSGGNVETVNALQSNAAGAGRINLSEGAIYTLTVGGGGGSGTFSGLITESSTNLLTLVKSGSGVQMLSGSNTYRGGTQVAGGVLRLGDAAALGSGTGGLTVNSGTLDLAGFSPTVGLLSGSAAGTITSASPATLTASSASSGTFSGVMAGAMGLTKAGAGVLTLGGVNTFAGPTRIQQGTLALGTGGSLAS